MTKLDNPYLTDQLIPYIGNKRKLLPLVHKAINQTGVKSGIFFDVFAGSGVVSRLAKSAGLQVIANDWEPYCEILNKVYISMNHPPAFANFGGIKNAIDTLNELSGQAGYIAGHYCPADDEAYDDATERMFYTQSNGRRIDAIREQIADWKESGKIDEYEEAALLAPLIYQASYCSNTSGVFKGFHRGWGGATKTAHYRILSNLNLSVPVFYNNNQDNQVHRVDASKLAEEIECDIAYLDPPYNQHQYGSNYHLLNTVALWDKPQISKLISINGERDKAAIRKDWRTQRRSAYCYKSSALKAFQELVSKLKARYILVSYSTDGIIELPDLLSCLNERGDLSVVLKQYKRYRVSSQRPSLRPHTTEFVAIVDTHKASQPHNIEQIIKEIQDSEERSI